MDTELFKEWFQAFAQAAGVTLHVENLYGENNHHIVESCFKGAGEGAARRSRNRSAQGGCGAFHQGHARRISLTTGAFGRRSDLVHERGHHRLRLGQSAARRPRRSSAWSAETGICGRYHGVVGEAGRDRCRRQDRAARCGRVRRLHGGVCRRVARGAGSGCSASVRSSGKSRSSASASACS